MHPQTSIHTLSLPSSNLRDDLLHPTTHEDSNEQKRGDEVEMVGNPAAQEFWLTAAKSIDWIKEPKVAYGRRKGESPSWFPSSSLNTCYNALDRHCLPPKQLGAAAKTKTISPPAVTVSPGAKPCLHWVSPFLGKRQSWSYSQALEQVKLVSGVLRERLGVRKGDRVVIYMPMIPETVFATLACTRIGAIHSIVFGGFSAPELAKRLLSARPAAILTASFGIEPPPKGLIDYLTLVEKALEIYNKQTASDEIGGKDELKGVVIFRREAEIDLTQEMGKARNGKWERDWDSGIGNLKILEQVEKFGRGRKSSDKIQGFELLDWRESCDRVKKDKKEVEVCEEVESGDPVYTLYTSGTTGMPKGVVRASGGHAVALRYSMEHTFGLTPNDTMFCASDLGWVVGHGYILYAPLFLGAATVVFEGKPIFPDAGVWWRIIEDYRVTCLFTAPTALRAISREDREGNLMRKFNLRSLKSVFLAGERSEPGIVNRYQGLIRELGAKGAIVDDNYWSTESGSPITAIMLSNSFHPLKPRPGSAGHPLPGMDVRVVNDDGKELPQGEMGNIVLARPLAPSALTGLWKDDGRFQEAYWDRFKDKGDWFDTGDAGLIDQDGYVHVLSRTDDIMNVAGHRLSTGLLEQVITSNDLVAECCVVGCPDEMKGHVPFALIARSHNDAAKKANMSEILKAINEHIRTDVGSIAVLGGMAEARLPKTRSGKTLRRTIRSLVENAAVGQFEKQAAFPPTIEDPTAVDDARGAINRFFVQRENLKKTQAKL